MGESSSFWDETWRKADRARIAAYVNGFDFSPDPILRFLREARAAAVCDAGCGCGVYALKLALCGFSGSGFDVSEAAVRMAGVLMASRGFSPEGFRRADIAETGYGDGCFDAVVARDVIDHMTLREGAAALKELLRIVKPGGAVVLTLDGTDETYESEPHSVSADGDYRFTGGRWKGMTFHPYTPDDVLRLTKGYAAETLDASDRGFTICVRRLG